MTNEKISELDLLEEEPDDDDLLVIARESTHENFGILWSLLKTFMGGSSVYAQVSAASGQTMTLTNNAWTKISTMLNTVDLDPSSIWSVADKKFTPPAGVYRVSGLVQVVMGANPVKIAVALYKNGAYYGVLGTSGAYGGGYYASGVGGSILVECDGNDDLEMYVRNTTGTNLTAGTSDGGGYSHFSLVGV